jgi:hypothetical protein
MLKILSSLLLLSLVYTASTCFAQMPSQTYINKNPERLGSFRITPSVPNTVKPSWILAAMKPGESINDSVIIENQGTDKKTLRLSARDGVYTKEGKFTVQSADKAVTGMGKWITLEQADIILEPNERKTIVFSIKVPGTVTLGEYKGGIAATETKKRDGDGALISATVALPIQVAVSNDPGPISKITGKTFFTDIFESNNGYFLISLVTFILITTCFIRRSVRRKKKKGVSVG